MLRLKAVYYVLKQKHKYTFLIEVGHNNKNNSFSSKAAFDIIVMCLKLPSRIPNLAGYMRTWTNSFISHLDILWACSTQKQKVFLVSAVLPIDHKFFGLWVSTHDPL